MTKTRTRYKLQNGVVLEQATLQTRYLHNTSRFQRISKIVMEEKNKRQSIFMMIASQSSITTIQLQYFCWLLNNNNNNKVPNS